MRAFGLVLLASAMLFSGCRNGTEQQQGGSSAPLDASQAAFLEGNSQFAFQLFQEIMDSSKPDQNLVCSPFGVQMLFSLMLNGAEGQVYDEIAETLGYGKGVAVDAVNRYCETLMQRLPADEKSLRLHVANSIWYDTAMGVLHPDFAQAATQFYKAEAHRVHFRRDVIGTAKKINAWVHQHTFGMIKELVRPMDLRQATFAGVNCVYFKGLFERAFERSKVQAEFRTETGRVVRFYPMVQRFEAIPYWQGEEVEIVALPYQGNTVRMYLLLPREGHSVGHLVASLKAGRWAQWLEQLRPTALRVEVPRFVIESEYWLNGILQQLGIRAAFGPLGFTKVYVGDADSIDFVRQKAKIKVDEEGTEAAAATIVILTRDTVMEPVFRADRPFVYVLRHEPTGVILFMGVLRQPME